MEPGHAFKFLTTKEATYQPRDEEKFVNTLSNKKCFVGRTVMIQSALHSSHLQYPPEELSFLDSYLRGWLNLRSHFYSSCGPVLIYHLAQS